MSKYFDGELLSGYEKSPKTTTSNTGNFVDLLNREMDGLVDDYTKRRISDLEAKLAESEKEKDYCQDLYFTSVKGQEKLKQQLAEKEKELKFVKEVKAKELGNAMAVIIENLSEQIKNIDELTLLDVLQRCNQDKISFCVEKLQEVKDILNNLQPPPNYPEYSCEFGFDDCRYKVEEIIDEKIENLQEKN